MSKGSYSEKGVITLCGSCQSCPEVDFTQIGFVLIRDDFGGQVKLTKQQWSEMKKVFVEKKER